MSKKIVIIPTFAESHLIDCQIPNIMDTINPDYIVYQEGLFPNGTEGNKEYDYQWLDKYTLDGRRAFDFNDLKNIIEKYQKQYPDTKIILNEVKYENGLSSTECFMKACLSLEDFNLAAMMQAILIFSRSPSPMVSFFALSFFILIKPFWIFSSASL